MVFLICDAKVVDIFEICNILAKKIRFYVKNT